MVINGFVALLDLVDPVCWSLLDCLLDVVRFCCMFGCHRCCERQHHLVLVFFVLTLLFHALGCVF